MTMKVYLDPPSKEDRQQIQELYIPQSDVTHADYKHQRLPTDHLYYLVLEGQLTLEQTGTSEFGVSVAGTAKLFVDGRMVVDNETKQMIGDSFFGAGTREEMGELKLQKGKTYNIRVVAGTPPTVEEGEVGGGGMGAGGVWGEWTRRTG